MITISLCMIVKDEEKVLKRCLDSAVSFADEIIIVDTGSSDSTKKIAETYTKKVYDFTWNDDFSAARNEAFRHAEMDYCMWLDADDIVSEPEQKKIQRLKEELDDDTAIVMMKYSMGFDKTGSPSLSYYRERLIKNHEGFAGREKSMKQSLYPERFYTQILKLSTGKQRREKKARGGIEHLQKDERGEGSIYCQRFVLLWKRTLLCGHGKHRMFQGVSGSSDRISLPPGRMGGK